MIVWAYWSQFKIVFGFSCLTTETPTTADIEKTTPRVMLMSELELRKLQKKYGETIAVRKVDLTLDEPKYCCLLGPSGCGKTLIADDCWSWGNLLWFSFDQRQDISEKPHLRPTSMMFQNYALFLIWKWLIILHLLSKYLEWTSPQGMVALCNAARSSTWQTSRSISKPIIWWAAATGCTCSRADYWPRVFTWRTALCFGPIFRIEMRAELKHWKLGISIHVTHSQDEAMALADLILVMNDGIVEQYGTPMEIFTHREMHLLQIS